MADLAAEFDAFLAELGYREPAKRTAFDDEAAFAGEAPDDAIQRAKRYLEKLPPAIQGQNGSAACFRAACVLRRGFALSMEQALQAIAEWNAKCEPPWSEWELRHKLEDAEKADGPRGHLLNAPKTRRR
jgi:hypothetical protein